MPALAAAVFTTSQMTLAVMPSPRDPTGLVDGAEHVSLRNARRGRPPVYSRFDPGGNRDGPDVPALAKQISDHPMLLALLERFERQGEQLGAAQLLQEALAAWPDDARF